MGSERVFEAERANEVELSVPVGVVTVHVVNDRTTARVVVTTDEAEGPHRDAVRAATFEENGDRLMVTVPELGCAEGVTVVNTHGGSITVRQDLGTVHVGQSVTGLVISSRGTMRFGTAGGMVVVNGQVITSGSVGSVGGLRVEVWLPVTTGLIFSTRAADLHTDGLTLGWLVAESVCGDMRLGTVNNLMASTTSGDVRVGHVRHSATVETVSGDIRITRYDGRDALLRSVSGDLLLIAGEAATGRVRARTVSGDIRLDGCAQLDARARTVSGRVRQR